MVCVAIWFMLDALLGTGRGGIGTLFFDKEGMEALTNQGAVVAQPMVGFCKDDVARDRFDSSSVKTLDAWCGAVRAFVDVGSPEDAVRLLRASNTRFARITDKMYNSGGSSADTSLELQEADRDLRPLLENVASECASAAFSQFLLGLFLLIPGLLVIRRFW